MVAACKKIATPMLKTLPASKKATTSQNGPSEHQSDFTADAFTLTEEFCKRLVRWSISSERIETRWTT